ncbi:MAG: SUMF1/EgtB/PvdO family nonheme iron enzyme, partial [Thermoanaerobaculia bacterium]
MRAGPAGRELGAYPAGEDDKPVGGVSFYEAAAYAEFVGKQLPTCYHWMHATGVSSSAVVSPRSNFDAQGPWVVGRGAMNVFGTHDMAGNVKEWCLNENGPGVRYILGGGWHEPACMFIDADAQPSWDRKPEYGFRCMKAPVDQRLVEASRPRHRAPAPVLRAQRPVSDEVFDAYRGLYSYDRLPLDGKVERTDTLDWAVRQREHLEDIPTVNLEWV